MTARLHVRAKNRRAPQVAVPACFRAMYIPTSTQLASFSQHTHSNIAGSAF